MAGPNRLRVSGGPLEADLNPRHPSGGMLRWRQAARDLGGVWKWVGQTARWVTIFSMTAAFVTIWLVSILDNSEQAKKERALYPSQQLRSETGLCASGASGH